MKCTMSFERKKLSVPHGLILGKPGSGKTFEVKREITEVFRSTNDDIIICDPKGEYQSLVQQLNGQCIKISPSSEQYINPMDIPMDICLADYSVGDNSLSHKFFLKSKKFIFSLCELMVGSGLSAKERSAIDHCVIEVYRNYINNPVPENMPILEDLYNSLCASPEPEADNIATAMEPYITGSLNLFNHRTNIDFSNRLVCFDISDIRKDMDFCVLAMLIVQEQVSKRVLSNKAEKKHTYYFLDEFHLLLNGEQSVSYLAQIWINFRMWGGIFTGITHNVYLLTTSKEADTFMCNSGFIYVFAQSARDLEILAQKLQMSNKDINYIKKARQGSGVLFMDNKVMYIKQPIMAVKLTKQ